MGPEFEASWLSGNKVVVRPQEDLHAASQLGWGLNEAGVERLKNLGLGEEFTFTPGGMNPITVRRLRHSSSSRVGCG